MRLRIQTWFPYGIQIALNGREWLKRSLAKEGIGFVAHRNKYIHIDDYERAQELLNLQPQVQWKDVLNGFLPVVFPTMAQTLGSEMEYYWTLWQSEWATDCIFSSPDDLSSLINPLIRHAHMTGTSERILRYMERPLKLNDQPYPNFKQDVITRLVTQEL